MAAINETLHAAEFIKSVANVDRSVDNGVIVSGAGNLPTGRVLGIVTASGKYANYNDAETDGTEVAAGILYEARDATSADKNAVIVRRDAEVDLSLLDWNSQAAPAITAGTADMAANGIVMR